MPGEIDLRGMVGLLRRQLKVILAVFLAVLGIAALTIFTTTPIYTATALVMVDPSGKNVLEPDARLDGGSSANARIDGEVVLAASDNVLLSVIDRENLIDDPEFRPELGFSARVLSFLRLREPTLPTPEEALRQTLGKLSSTVTVQRRGLTFLIAINARSLDPSKAARLANAIAQAYIDSQLNAKVESTLDARGVLLSQMASARQAVVASEGSFDRYIDTNLGAIIDQTGNSELANLQEQISGLSALRQQTNDEVLELQGQVANQDYASLSERLADQAIQSLEVERQSILGQLETSDNSPLAVNLRDQLASIEKDIETRAKTQISTLQQELNATQNNETNLRQNLRSAILSSGLSADALTTIYDLQQQSELARQQYDQLQARSQQLQAEATLQLADSRVVSEALRPGAPSWPNTRLLLVLAALGGLALGVVLAFLYEHFIGGITTQDQLANFMRTTSATAVPRSKLQPGQLSLSQILTTGPLSSYAESIRRVRATIDQATGGLQGQSDSTGSVVLVTSTVPGEGKTTLSLSIAKSYALSGRRTLLVDCDLRRPSVQRQLGITAEKGLIDALLSTDVLMSLGETLSQDAETGLTVLMGSRRSDVPTDDLVAGRQFMHLMDAARKTFDIIVLDTPPLGPVVDGLYLARYADAAVYVVQWAATSQSEIRRSVTSLQGSLREGVEIIPVLNQQDMAASTYYRQYAGYYGADPA